MAYHLMSSRPYQVCSPPLDCKVSNQAGQQNYSSHIYVLYRLNLQQII